MKTLITLIMVVAISASVFGAGYWAPANIQTNSYLKDVPALLSNNFQAIDNIVDDSDPSDLKVNGAKISSASIALVSLAADSVNSSKIVDLSIGTSDLGALCVNGAKLASDSVSSSKIVDGSIGSDDLSTNCVTAGKISDGACGASELAANCVTAGKISDGACGTSELADGAVTSDKLSTALWTSISATASADSYSFYVMPILMAWSGAPWNIHIKTKQGGAYTTGLFVYRMWVSDYGSYAPTTNAFDSCVVTTGSELTSVAGTEFHEAMTDSSGELIFTATETGFRENMTVHVVLIGPAQNRTFSVVIP